MKKITLLTASLLITTLCFSQRLQLKKGILSEDGQPVAKLEGKATLFKTNVTIKSLSDTPLLSVERIIKTFGSPFHEGINYYEIRFIPTGKVASLLMTGENSYTSEKNLAQYIFDTIGHNFFSNDQINQEIVDAFFKGDQSEQIRTDTLMTRNLITLSKEKLTEPLIPRDGNTYLRLNSLKKETISTAKAESLETFDIYQGNVVIGRVLKRIKGDKSIPGAATYTINSAEYVVMRRVSPFVYRDKNEEFVNMALVKGDGEYPDIYVECEKAWAKDVKLPDIYTAEYQITSWLISKGCL
jgi:hypothetical protein